MNKPDKKESIKKSTGSKHYDYDVDRMLDEGLAGGEIDSRYKSPSIDHSRPVKKEKKPKDT